MAVGIFFLPEGEIERSALDEQCPSSKITIVF
jgi:hypothetical protein